MPLNPSTNPQELYFGMQAEMGITKHAGGKRATKELIELCNITKGSRVLDIGCGIGKTACFIAKKVGCKVVGVDLNAGMIERSKERTKRKGLEGRTEFLVADALNLPFKDNSFDAVISESVVAFFKDKQKGLNEYTRVVKPGGFIGINEVTWVKPPPQKIVEYMLKTTGSLFMDSDGWRKLLEGSRLKEIKVNVHKIRAFRQFFDEIGWIDLRDVFRATYKMLWMFFKSPKYRNYFKNMGVPPLSITKYMANGIYVGRKP